MRCEDIKRFASLYIDGEFDELEGARFEDHLEHCEACRDMIQSTRVFQQALVERLNPPQMPRAVRERILEAVELEFSAAPRPWIWKVPMAAAASIVLAVGIYAAFPGVGENAEAEEVETLVEESVAVHEAALPPEVEGNEDAVRGFLAEKAHLDLRPPIAENDSTRLLGVRLTRIGKSRAVLYHYLHNNRSVSVVQVPRRHLESLRGNRQLIPASTRVLYDGARRGYNITLFEGSGSTNTVVSDMPSRELRKLIPASL